MKVSLETIYEVVLKGDAKKTEAEVAAALEAKIPAESILYKACIPALSEVGRLFEEGEVYLPEMLIAARAMQAGMDLMRPHLAQAGVEPLGKVVLGTVAGDLHDIGKNLVGMMLVGTGFQVIDLGTDVASGRFVDAVREEKAQIVGLSCLLTTTMPAMRATMELLTEAGLRNQVKVLVGGAPVTQDFADEIGADGFAPDASSGARIAKELLGFTGGASL